MNEKLMSLLNTARLEIMSGEGVRSGIALSYEEIEKFAELIIRECAMFVVVELEGQIGSRIADATANRLEEHFGVEE